MQIIGYIICEEPIEIINMIDLELLAMNCIEVIHLYILGIVVNHLGLTISLDPFVN